MNAYEVLSTYLTRPDIPAERYIGTNRRQALSIARRLAAKPKQFGPRETVVIEWRGCQHFAIDRL